MQKVFYEIFSSKVLQYNNNVDDDDYAHAIAYCQNLPNLTVK